MFLFLDEFAKNLKAGQFRFNVCSKSPKPSPLNQATIMFVDKY